MRRAIRRTTYILPLLVLAISGVLSVWHPARASADSAYNYTDGSFKTIVGPTGTFKSLNKTSGNFAGAYEHETSECNDYIWTDDKKYDGDTSAKALIHCPHNPDADKIPITIDSIPSPVGDWVDHSKVNVTFNGQQITLFDNKIDGNLTYVAQSDDDCTSKDQVYGFSGSASDPDTGKETAKMDVYTIPGGGDNSCVEIGRASWRERV